MQNGHEYTHTLTQANIKKVHTSIFIMIYMYFFISGIYNELVSINNEL